jgi:predicted nucleic acid-binding protein
MNYLVLIEHVDVLPVLFERIVLPSVVQAELSHPSAPASVRDWISQPPSWLEIAEAPPIVRTGPIHPGEAAAIELALSLHADLLLIDDRAGVSFAKQKGLRVTGTLGVRDLAASRGLINFKEAIARLRSTSFRLPETILTALIEKHDSGNG